MPERRVAVACAAALMAALALLVLASPRPGLPLAPGQAHVGLLLSPVLSALSADATRPSNLDDDARYREEVARQQDFGCGAACGERNASATWQLRELEAADARFENGSAVAPFTALLRAVVAERTCAPACTLSHAHGRKATLGENFYVQYAPWCLGPTYEAELRAQSWVQRCMLPQADRPRTVGSNQWQHQDFARSCTRGMDTAIQNAPDSLKAWLLGCLLSSCALRLAAPTLAPRDTRTRRRARGA